MRGSRLRATLSRQARVLAMLASLFIAESFIVAQPVLPRMVQGAGGGLRSTGAQSLNDTIGQVALGAACSTNYSIEYGFWTEPFVAAQPSLTWRNPEPIVYGTPLGSVQLNASASVPGGLAYFP